MVNNNGFSGRALFMSLLLFFIIASPPHGRGATPESISDSLYSAHHPCILFNPAELPALRAKVLDGGYDDTAYNYLRYLAKHYYPTLPLPNLLGGEFGLNAIPNLGLAAFLESPVDTASINLGREATLYLADNYDVDFNEANSGLRLRGLTLGYDMFFEDAPESVRTYVRDEIVGYMEFMTTMLAYELWEYRPYLANHSAMFGGPLGLAAICLQDEADSLLSAEAMAMADRIVNNLVAYQIDPDGAYKEGGLYGAWTTRQYIYYFHARKRFDGYNYGDNPAIRNMERWFAYELLPEGYGKTNNLNDSPYYSVPLARHTTYFDWAQEEWNSGLAAWLWEHLAGPFGFDWQWVADKASTVLWNRPLATVQPDSVLPNHFLWLDRGLYYYRSGWQSGLSSNDIVFSFYSGKFHGGHAQEDQNQFTLYGYGEKLVIDHGSAKESESHNMVFIDGAGQHNAGASIGTDGRISEYVLSDFADYLLGDATDAYTTYSEFNNPDVPIPGIDWSWGYKGANPVEHAYRRVVVVHHEETPPYFVIMDDIDKDGQAHDYQWRLHTLITNTVDIATNPIHITGAVGSMDLHALYPDFASLAISAVSYDNGNPDPNATLITANATAVNPKFSFLLFPSDTLVTVPVVTREVTPWGFACTLDWGGGAVDVLLGNHSGGLISYDSLSTDASFALVRLENSNVKHHLLINANVFLFSGVEHVRVFDGPVNCGLAGNVIELDRIDPDFRFLDSGVDRIEYRSETVQFVRAGGYLLPAAPSAAGQNSSPAVSFEVRSYPNPFNPATAIHVDVKRKTPIDATVFDALGRRVVTLHRGPLNPGHHVIRWNGRNDRGGRVPSGVYFLKVTGHDHTRSIKLTVVR